MWKFDSTNLILAEQMHQLKNQTELISEAMKLLEDIQKLKPGTLPAGVIYEVSFQPRNGDQSSVKTGGPRICDAYNEAVLLWGKVNANTNNSEHGRATVFVCNEKFRFVLQPEDVNIIVRSEGVETIPRDAFTTSCELTDIIGQIVWKKDEELPGWHSKDFTADPEKTSEDTLGGA